GTAAARATAPACRHIPAHFLPGALALPGMAYGLLPPGWTLSVEFLVSLLFPLLLALGRRSLALLFALALALLFVREPHAKFLVFVLDFALGIAMHLERERLARWLGAFSRRAWILWLLGALVLIQTPYALRIGTTGQAQLAGHTPPVVLLMGLGAAMLMAAGLYQERGRRGFEAPPPPFFGPVSYSLSLVHHTVIFAFQCRLLGHERLDLATGILLFAAVLAISTAIAAAGFRWIEAPSIEAGRALIRLSRRRRPPPARPGSGARTTPAAG